MLKSEKRVRSEKWSLPERKEKGGRRNGKSQADRRGKKRKREIEKRSVRFIRLGHSF